MNTKSNVTKTDDMTKSELISKIANSIKAYAGQMKRASETFPIRFNYWTGGGPDRVWHQSVIRHDGKDIIFRKTEITYDDFLCIMERALALSGCKGSIKSREWEEEVGRWPHSHYVTKRIFESLILLAKPCDEFKKLNDKLAKLGNKVLPDDAIYYVSICGKRNSWGESGTRLYLCHNPKLCKKALDFIKAKKATRDNLITEIVEEIDKGEDYSYAMRYETEWYGSTRMALKLQITTPSGKVKGELKVA